MRILVVEDEARIAADIVGGLARVGYIAELARDGEEAWFRGETENFDAMVLDLGLPKLDGLSVVPPSLEDVYLRLVSNAEAR